MMQLFIFALAALFEIGGCYLVWLAMRGPQLWLWAPAVMALAIFAWLLTLTGVDSAGRVFAVYGGIYIVASVLFMAIVKKIAPDRWDLIGAAVCILGAAIIVFGPRVA